VAFGVGLAWLLSVSLVPAYIMLFVPRKTLDKLELPQPKNETETKGLLNRFLQGVGHFAVKRRKVVMGLLALGIVLAVLGINRIQVNDNPVLWFVPSHRIRVADKVLNHHFGGTYTAYLEFVGPENINADPVRVVEEATPSGGWPELMSAAQEGKTFAELFELAAELDTKRFAQWEPITDTVLYLDPEGLTPAEISTALQEFPQNLREQVLNGLPSLSGAELQDAVLDRIESLSGSRWEDRLRTAKADAEAPAFKQPAVLRWVSALQEHLKEGDQIGKSTSAADAVKKAHYELRRDGDQPEEYRIPDTASGVAQVFLQLEGMKKKDSLFHLVDRDYQRTNVWLQLTSGDNRNMLAAKDLIEEWIAENPPPIELETEWAGLTYLNVVWQERMVGGMLEALAGSFVVVLVMMVFLFRSIRFGLLSMVPLTMTIGLTYGIIGWVGKAYDMPVAVLSSLTLGLSVDFAIHFLQRARELVKEKGSWSEAAPLMFREPARAISRNAIVIALGFTPLLLAPLMPYKTVGFFLATIMGISWLATLVILTSLLTLLSNVLFPAEKNAAPSTSSTPETP
jgi:predicted RND superfamily exporter protein